LKANAEGLQSTLKSAGYDAQVAYNAGINMYRVVASTFDSKADAVNSRNHFRAKYPDAWLLFKK
jgi:cell division protein FtsN